MSSLAYFVMVYVTVSEYPELAVARPFIDVGFSASRGIEKVGLSPRLHSLIPFQI